MGRKRTCITIKYTLLSFMVVLLIQCLPQTRKKDIVRTIAPRHIYSKDSVELLTMSKYFMKRSIGAFGGETYHEDKQIYLDSILYSPDLNKMVFWVITKDSTTHLTDEKMPDMLFCYNGHILYAIRKSVNDTVMVREYSFYSTVFNKSYEMAHNSLYNESFINKRMSNIRSNPESAHNYDDIRSWEEPMWDEIAKEPHWYLSDTAVLKIENNTLINGKWRKE